MSVGRPAGSSSKAPLQIIYVIMLLFLTICLSYVPLFLFFFQGIHNENDPNKGSDAVRTLQSGTNLLLEDYKIWKPSVTFWSVTFQQRFDLLVEFECIFWRFWVWNTFYLTVIMTYDRFKAIKRFGSSTFSFILLHLLSYILFNYI